MRITFDGSSLRPRRTGVGYYSEHLLRHLAQEASVDELIVISNCPIETTTPLPARVRVVAPPWRVPRMVWMQTIAPQTVKRLEADVAHFTNGMMPLASPVPTVVTIHDISLTLYPRFHPPRRVLLNRPLVNVAARRADAVITVSESARREIVRLYQLDPRRVQAIHEAAAPSFHPVRDPAELERVRRKYGLDDRIILYVGTIEPRKNLPALIEAFARRRSTGDLSHQLVCVGPYGWLSRGIESSIARSGVAHAIAFTGYVPFADLPALYSLAEMFVFPSVYEGFGLPVVEAMACGVPVITGPTPALAEVAGGAIEQVDHLDAGALGDAMVALARSRERRQHLAAQGIERAQTFSWRRAARETLDIYRRTAERASGIATADPPPAFADVGIDPVTTSHAAVRESSQPWSR